MNVDVSEGDCDAGSLSPWIPARADGGSAEARLGRLKAEIEVLLAAFCEKELQVDATDCAMSEESELFSISRPVAGLAWAPPADKAESAFSPPGRPGSVAATDPEPPPCPSITAAT